MAIFRWGSSYDPFAALRHMQRELERLAWPSMGDDRRVGGGAYPPVNVYDSANEVLVQCEAPGVDPEEMDLTITGDTLTIKGVKRGPDNEEKLNFVRRERGSGEFTRTIVLPDSVDADKIDASMRNGVMTIRLPKSAAAKPRKIEVKSA